MEQKKGDATARMIVANLISRQRRARRELRRALALAANGTETALAMAVTRHSEAHNAAEASRRILYGNDEP